jgi:hypothetical protein
MRGQTVSFGAILTSFILLAAPHGKTVCAVVTTHENLLLPGVEVSPQGESTR